jgi:hypothetical protein
MDFFLFNILKNPKESQASALYLVGGGAASTESSGQGVLNITCCLKDLVVGPQQSQN